VRGREGAERFGGGEGAVHEFGRDRGGWGNRGGGGAVEGADGIVVWSADGGQKERYRMYAGAIAFAKDGRLAFTSVDESGILDRKTGCAQRWKVRGRALRIGADGRIVIAGDGHVRALDPNGTIVHDALLEGPVALDVADDTVAVLDGLHGLHLYPSDLSSVRDVASVPDGLGNAQVVAIAPDRSLVAAGAVEKYAVKYPPGTMPGSPYRHRTFVRLVALPAATEIERFESDVYALAFSPDSATLAVADDRYLSIRKVSDKTTRVLDDKLSFAQQLVWSADRKTLALAEWRGSVRVYDVATGSARVLAP
jgi:WD40 repeat protein